MYELVRKRNFFGNQNINNQTYVKELGKSMFTQDFFFLFRLARVEARTI